MEPISKFAAQWYSVVQNAILDPTTKFYIQDAPDAVQTLLSYVQNNISSSRNCSETEDPTTIEEPGSLDETASCLTSNQRMILNSLLSDLKAFSLCMHSEATGCAADDYFKDIIILKDAFSNWKDAHWFSLHSYLWPIYNSSFAPGLYDIWKYWNDNNNREMYALSPDPAAFLRAADFFKNALPPTDTEFRKLNAVSD